LGVPAAQSACYGLRYRFGAAHFATQTLRMPNAIEKMSFCEGGASPRPRIYSFII